MSISAIGRNLRSTARNIRNVTAAAIIAATPMAKSVAKAEGGAIFNSGAINVTSSSNFVAGSANVFTNIKNTICIKADENLTGPFTNIVKKLGNLVVGYNGNPTNSVFTGISTTTSGDVILKIQSLTDKGALVNDTVTLSGKTLNPKLHFFKLDIRETSMPTK